MGFQAIQDTPIQVNLLTQINYTGWALPGDGSAVHSSCQSGYCTLTSFPTQAGHSYQISYMILSISGGSVNAQAGGTNGGSYTTPQLVVETITAAANGFLKFYSNANCQITYFNISDQTNTTGTTIVWNRLSKKWSDFRTMYPDYGWSIDTQTILAYNGNLYKQDNAGVSTFNNFFGTQFQTTVQVVGNSQPTEVKKFKSISYQSNALWGTTAEGITTSLGQISHLDAQDFLKSVLTSTSGAVDIYTKEGVYSAQLLRDQNTNLLNGDKLKGNWIIIELETSDGSVPVQLFTVGINDKFSRIGVR